MKRSTNSKTLILLSGAALIALLLAGCDKAPDTAAPSAAPSTSVSQGTGTAAPAAEKKKVQLMHVHGLSYSPDGSKILIPSHHGLAVFSGAGWSKAPGPQHDYMGFSATRDAIYSSGHPAPDAGLVNPFGVIKSTDGGQTWHKLGFEGESDFHLLTTGYETNAVYVLNSQPNSKMKTAGIYYTLNDGFSWQRAEARGLQGNPRSIAVHPSDPKLVAVGTDSGLYLSQNAGAKFDKVGTGEVLGLFFNLGGKHLWFSFSSVEGQPGVSQLTLDSKQTRKIPVPPMEKDAVAYIAQNPVKRNEYAIATFQRSVYVSQDEGQTWKQIAEKGEGY